MEAPPKSGVLKRGTRPLSAGDGERLPRSSFVYVVFTTALVDGGIQITPVTIYLRNWAAFFEVLYGVYLVIPYFRQ